jgi:16S rRNA (cytosine967-C5)-methyltransferase
VLVDAPCSNTGVMRRRVDLRWRIQPDEIERLAALQRDLVHRSSLCVRPGGILVYSTCSLESEENRAVVDAFLGEHPQFELLEDRELFPPETHSDGAYAAKLRRSK